MADNQQTGKLISMYRALNQHERLGERDLADKMKKLIAYCREAWGLKTDPRLSSVEMG
jgi:hypothetical protein